MKGIKEAPFIKSFSVAPKQDDDENDLFLYKGWLPIDDEMNDVDSEPTRIALEAFVREVINAK